MLMKRAVPIPGYAPRAVVLPLRYEPFAAPLCANRLVPENVLLRAIAAHSAIVWTRDCLRLLRIVPPLQNAALRTALQAGVVLGVVLNAFEASPRFTIVELPPSHSLAAIFTFRDSELERSAYR